MKNLTNLSNPNGRRGSKIPGFIAWTAGLGVCVAALMAGQTAAADEFTVDVELAPAFWLDHPQSERFTPGPYVAIRPGVSLGRVVALQWSYGMLAAPAGAEYDELGTAHFLTSGVRIRPLGTMLPKGDQGGLFMDFDLGYVRTGDLDRFGFDAGLGYNFQATEAFALGPVVRYGHIIQRDGLKNIDPNDAQFLTVGLNLAFGTVHKDAPMGEPVIAPPVEEKVCPEAPECVAVTPVKVIEPLCTSGDGDKDGVCDDQDRCPTQSGPGTTWGCPIDPCSGKPLVVLVQFPYDSSKLPVPVQGDVQTMDPVLDAVAAAIAQDNSCRVCVVGNASEEGGANYNQTLSAERGRAVQDYLTARGIGRDRIPTTGLGKRCQLVPEASRPLNRRVEFRRLQEGESCPVDCTP